MLVETRLFWKRGESNWASGTYIWDDAGEAHLDTSKQPTLLANGYEIPIAKDCGKCHHGGADKLLGIEAVALGLPTAKGATLTQLVADGWLSAPPPRTTIDLPADATGLAGPALGYLHANCAHCHRFGGGTGAADHHAQLRRGGWHHARLVGANDEFAYLAARHFAVVGIDQAQFDAPARLAAGGRHGGVGLGHQRAGDLAHVEQGAGGDAEGTGACRDELAA